MNIKNLADVISSSSVILDCLQVNIFIADRDFNLAYMNPKAEKTLKNIQNVIVEVFNLKVEDLIGESLLSFHNDPDNVKNIVNNPMAVRHEVMFEFGGVLLETCISSIIGSDGEMIGYIVNWEDVSEEVERKEEIIKLFEKLELLESESNNF